MKSQAGEGKECSVKYYLLAWNYFKINIYQHKYYKIQRSVRHSPYIINFFYLDNYRLLTYLKIISFDY